MLWLVKNKLVFEIIIEFRKYKGRSEHITIVANRQSRFQVSVWRKENPFEEWKILFPFKLIAALTTWLIDITCLLSKYCFYGKQNEIIQDYNILFYALFGQRSCQFSKISEGKKGYFLIRKLCGRLNSFYPCLHWYISRFSGGVDTSITTHVKQVTRQREWFVY